MNRLESDQNTADAQETHRKRFWTEDEKSGKSPLPDASAIRQAIPTLAKKIGNRVVLFGEPRESTVRDLVAGYLYNKEYAYVEFYQNSWMFVDRLTTFYEMSPVEKQAFLSENEIFSKCYLMETDKWLEMVTDIGAGDDIDPFLFNACQMQVRGRGGYSHLGFLLGSRETAYLEAIVDRFRLENAEIDVSPPQKGLYNTACCILNSVICYPVLESVYPRYYVSNQFGYVHGYRNSSNLALKRARVNYIVSRKSFNGNRFLAMQNTADGMFGTQIPTRVLELLDPTNDPETIELLMTMNREDIDKHGRLEALGKGLESAGHWKPANLSGCKEMFVLRSLDELKTRFTPECTPSVSLDVHCRDCLSRFLFSRLMYNHPDKLRETNVEMIAERRYSCAHRAASCLKEGMFDAVEMINACFEESPDFTMLLSQRKPFSFHAEAYSLITMYKTIDKDGSDTAFSGFVNDELFDENLLLMISNACSLAVDSMFESVWVCGCEYCRPGRGL